MKKRLLHQMAMPLNAAVIACTVSMLTIGVNAETIVVKGETVYTMSGAPIRSGVVVIENGKIQAVGPAATTRVPDGARVLEAAIVTPGLIDAHTTVGMAGILNQPHDQEQLDKTGPLQPELRAIDAYNPRDPLVEYVRSLGVTTIHTGHAPGALISGQTMIVKTVTNDFESAILVKEAMVAATLGQSATSGSDKPPGTSSKAIAMLRAELLKATDYAKKRQKADEEKRSARDLHLEALTRIVEGKQPLLITAHRHKDILGVLRLADEFKLRVVLDGVADAHLVIDEIKRSGFPVIVHPTMYRATGETENLSFTTPSTLQKAGIPFAMQSGYESYVPKTRIVLFEAAIAAAHGLNREQALASITSDAARLLGIADRVGSLEPGKNADVALFDGDPFEYTTHCAGVILNGVVVSQEAR